MLRSLIGSFQHTSMQMRRVLREYLITLPLEPILHPSTTRIRWLGLFTFGGHPLFFLIWGYWLVQPYENSALRMLISLLGLILVLPYINRDPTSTRANIAFVGIFWFQMPLFFSWMYLCNNGNTVWLASLSVMILIWYHITDWRIATIGLVTGGILAWILFEIAGPVTSVMNTEQLAINSVVIAFSFSMALLLGALSANARQAELTFSKEKNKALQALSGSIAHEMRNPLSQIKYSLDCIGNSLPAPTSTDLAHPIGAQTLHELYRNVAQGHIAIKRGLQVISMTLSEVSSQAIDRSHFDYISAAIATQKAVDEYGYETQEERKKVRVQIQQDFIFKGEETLYIFILFNLIKNALYYFKSYPNANLTITVIEGKVLVRDTGPGIPDKVRVQLFEAFKTSGKAQGTGLGLAYCKRAMLAFDGQISCDSVLGQYTEFILQFAPLSAEELNAYKQTVLEQARAVLTGKRLLVVDDDDRLRSSTKQLLSVLNIDVDEAGNGQLALQALQKTHYDLILMDINMPVLDGYTATEQIRAGVVPACQSIPILAYTSELPYMAEVKTQKVGMNGFVSKPCSQLELIKAVQGALEAAAKRAAASYQSSNGRGSDPLVYTATDLTAQLKGKTVLIADDEAINRRIVRTYVEQWEMRVIEAEHGMDVLTVLQENSDRSIDIILMDMHMPGLSGIQTTQAIREQTSTFYQNIPIIALTADSSEERVQAALEAGMNAFITKPIEQEILREKLSELLNKAHQNPQKAVSQIHSGKTLSSVPLAKAEDSAVLNRARLDEMRKLTPDLLQESIPIYIERMRVLQERISLGLDNKDLNDVHEALHSLLGISGDCGAKLLHQFIRHRIYPEIDRGFWPSEERWLETIASLRAQAQAALEEYLLQHFGAEIQ